MSLLRTPLRWTGALVLSLAIGAALRTPLPDVLIAPGAQAVAVRTSDGRLTIARTGSDTFAIREWLAADGDPRNPGDASVGSGFRCDELGCVAALGDGRLVALAIRPEAFLEDCARAAIVVSARERPPDCSAQVIDRTASQQNGAMALRRAGEVFAVEAARPSNYDRPWSWRESARSRPAPVPNQDATPAPEQREVDD